MPGYFLSVRLSAKRVLQVCLTVTCLTQTVLAQHCPYDMVALAGIHPVSAQTGEFIPGLRITLLNPDRTEIMKEVPVLNKKGTVSGYEKRPARFLQNPGSTRFRGLIDNNNPAAYDAISFDFAGTDYVYITGRNRENAWTVLVRIEDTDGEANGGYFETRVLELDLKLIYLCGYGKGSFKGEYEGRVVEM